MRYDTIPLDYASSFDEKHEGRLAMAFGPCAALVRNQLNEKLVRIPSGRHSFSSKEAHMLSLIIQQHSF